MTDNPVIEKLRKLIILQGDQATAAEYLGISPSMLSLILKGKREISKELAEKLGFTRLTVYEPIILDAQGYGDQFGKLYEKMDARKGQAPQ